jgi:stearoyl-CoA desaturase (delta-9 desaturase)
VSTSTSTPTSAVAAATSSRRLGTYFNLTSIPFWAAHAVAIASLIAAGWHPHMLLFTLAVYAGGMFFVTAGYHRYFSHRSYKTSRPFQLFLALGAQATSQKGVLWWASVHRHHHRTSDTVEDAHSAKQHGFWWSHMGWFLGPDFRQTDLDSVKDLARYPELRWLNKISVCFLPALAYAAIMYWLGGLTWFAYGTFFPLVLIWHGTYTINSLAHLIGRRRYQTTDESKNSLPLALLTFGEGWHNNHHHYQRSCRQGFRAHEIDITYYLLRVLGFLGVVWDIGEPPRHVVENRPKPTRAAVSAGGDPAAALRGRHRDA